MKQQVYKVHSNLNMAAPCKNRCLVFFNRLAGFGLAVMLGITQLSFAANAPLATSSDLLDAEEAFQVTARMKDAKTIELNYIIADGYYLYRKRFKFAAEQDSAILKTAITPTGKVKQDATFGRVETYRKSVRVLLPIAKLGNVSGGGGGNLIKINVILQGCADIGVCYPPLQHKFVLNTGSRERVTSNPGSEQAPEGAIKPAASISDLIRKVP